MHREEASDLFYEYLSAKALKHEFILNTPLPRKQKHPNYNSLDNCFQVDKNPMGSEEHHWDLPNDHVRVKPFEALDLIMASASTRFN